MMQVFARRAGREIAIGLLYVAAAVILTWPLAIRLSTSVSDPGDPLLTTWILDWTCKALLHHPLRLFDAPVFHPAVMPLAFSEHFVGVALLVLPFHLAGATPLTVFNLAMLLGFALSGYGAFVLARMFTSSFVAAFLGGAFFAFVSFKFDHVAHLQLISSGWLPLMLAALLAYRQRPTWKRAALFGAAFVMNGLTNLYYLLFAIAAIAVTLIFLFFADAKRGWRYWLRLAVVIAVACAVLLPFLLPYRTVSTLYNMKRYEEELRGGSGVWHDWLRITVLSHAYGDLIPPDRHKSEHQLFPGLFAIVMVVVAFVMTPRPPSPLTPLPAGERGNIALRILDILLLLLGMAVILAAMSDPRYTLKIFGRTFISIRGTDLPTIAFLIVLLARLSIRLPLAWGGDRGRTLRDAVAHSRFGVGGWVSAFWIAVGLLGVLGLNSFFYTFLYDRIAAYQSMRAPSRFAIIAYTGAVPFVALGCEALLRNRRGVKRALVAAGLLLAAYIDLRPRTQWEQYVTATPPVYRWLKSARPAPVLEWPVDNWLAFRYLYGATHHGVTIMNGSAAWEPPVYRDMRVAWDEKNYARVLDVAEANGARVIVVHGHWLGEFGNEPAVLGALRSAVDSGRLQFLRRFDHGIHGDFVFAVTKNFPGWKRLRAPDHPDGAGHMPSEELARFLRGESTWSDTPFGFLEQPRGTAKGPLLVSGWAIAPAGIRRIDVLLEEGRHRFEAIRVPRPEISKKYPWYYEDHPGFTLVIPKRPRGVDDRTDVQVEIIDNNGRATRLDDQYVEWDDRP